MKKVALVTGSSRGIGAVTIKEFAKRGYNVVINCKTNIEKANSIGNEIENLYNVKALIIKCDISKEEEVKKMFSIIMDVFGRIDVLVNNASCEISSDFNEKNTETFRKILDTNVIGTFLVSKYAGSIMINQKCGKIINISSNNALDKYDPSTLEYDGSKAAIISLTNNLAKEFSPYINVNCIAPGWVETEDILELDKSLDGKFIEEESKKIYLKRFAKCEEISSLILFLASDDANYINNAIIRIDGGC